MSFFFRIIALLLAFTLPVYGFASVSKNCGHQGMEQAGSAMIAAGSGVDAASDAAAGKSGFDQSGFTHASCSPSDSGHQCQIGILPSPLVIAELVPPVYSSAYDPSFAQAFPEQPQRPPSAA
jgi:hypothetical protein